MRLPTRWLILLGCFGLILAGWLVWAMEHTAPPPPPVYIADVVAVVGLLVGPWLVLVGRQLTRQLDANPEAGRVYSRALRVAVVIVVGGLATAVVVGVLLTGTGPQQPGASESAVPDALDVQAVLAVGSVVVGALVALVGAVLLPWAYLLTRTVTRERAARVRAEERAEMAAHLHDTVLQALTLIQKQTADPAVLRLARGTERELRGWLYGASPAGGDDFAAAVRALAAQVEDRFNVTIELGVVGTCRLGDPSRAVLGAIGEALTNAAKHAGIGQVSGYVEIADGEIFGLVRDRGRGFDPSVSAGANRRGIADSIQGRMRQHGGTAAVRSIPGQGTEVELRMPLAAMAS